jgi:iron complex outermembrane recepter protein
MRTKGSLNLSTTLLTAAAVCLTGVAAAQTTSGTDASGLDEVVVSARKRQEALKDIPGSVSVISEDVLREVGGIVDPLQLGDLLPGLQVDDENLPEYKARGAGVATNTNAEASVLQLRNGASIAAGFGGRAFTRIDQFDTRQIEFYRGAQGAMFGRNAVGGVLNVVNNLPNENLEWNGLASLGFDKEQVRAEGVLNVPMVADRLFLRTGVQYSKEKGLYWNEFLYKPALPLESLGVRVGLRALFSEATDATLFLDWEDYHHQDFIDSGTRRTGVSPETYLTIGALDDRGNPLPATSGYQANSPYDERRSAVDTDGFYRLKTKNLNLTVNHSLSFATLQSITNYRDRSFNTLVDADQSYIGGPAATVTVLRAGQLPGVNSTTNSVCVRTVTNAQRQFTSVTTQRACTNANTTSSSDFSQELRLLSSSEGRFKWLAGVDYRDFSNPVLEVRDGRFPNLTGAGQFYNYSSDSEIFTKSYGAFLSAEYNITDSLMVAGSARYTSEEKGLKLRVLQLDNAPPQLETSADESLSVDGVDPTFTVSYKFGQQMVYASLARANRSGGYNRASGTANAPANIAGIAVPLRYNDEKSENIEFGLKGEWSLFSFPFQYGIVAYQADYTDILRSAVVLAGGGSGDADTVILGSQLVNIGDAEVRGLDIELQGVVERFLWTAGSLRWNIGYTRTDSEILSGPAAGEALQDVPKDNYNANLSYRRGLAGGPNGLDGFFVRLNGEYESPKTPSTSTLQVDPRRRLNANIGIDGDASGRPWQLTLFIDNVLGFDDILSRGNLNTYEGQLSVNRQLVRRSEPRTMGIRFTMSSAGSRDRR